MSRNYQIRSLTADDATVVQDVLFGAADWNPDSPIPVSQSEALAHPALEMYHEDWGRRGDGGVVAEADGEMVGGAYYRLFTDDHHGHGYIDETTPELAIAVQASWRGQGVGGALLAALEAEARSDGVTRLSLSVDADNPARHLYERMGYEVMRHDGGGLLMAKDLGNGSS